MGASGDYWPAMAMLSLQCSYAGVALFTRAALLQGMSPRVSVVYRQAMATLIIAPIAYFSRRKSRIPPLGFKSFSLIFLTAFIVYIKFFLIFVFLFYLHKAQEIL